MEAWSKIQRSFPVDFNTGLWTALDWGMIWIAVRSFKNSSLEIFLSRKNPCCLKAAWATTHKSDCSSLTCQRKRPFIKRSLLEPAQTTNEQPQVNMMPTMWPLLSPLQPLLSGSAAFPAPASAYSSAASLAVGLGAGLWHVCLWWQKCLWKMSRDSGFLIHQPACFQSKGMKLKGDWRNNNVF